MKDSFTRLLPDSFGKFLANFGPFLANTYAHFEPWTITTVTFLRLRMRCSLLGPAFFLSCPDIYRIIVLLAIISKLGPKICE